MSHRGRKITQPLQRYPIVATAEQRPLQFRQRRQHVVTVFARLAVLDGLDVRLLQGQHRAE